MYAQKSFHIDIFFMILPASGNWGIPVPSAPFSEGGKMIPDIPLFYIVISAGAGILNIPVQD